MDSTTWMSHDLHVPFLTSPLKPRDSKVAKAQHGNMPKTLSCGPRVGFVLSSRAPRFDSISLPGFLVMPALNPNPVTLNF